MFLCFVENLTDFALQKVLERYQPGLSLRAIDYGS